ncbi:MAG: hypothetical protein IE922_01485 [Sphingomonadales bacterium]|nr:hypothetical protein [Sphingomonadales bacterium]
MSLTRVDNWRAAFAAEVERLRRLPFAWGTHDCGVGLAGNLTLALTGVDVAAPWRGRYTTQAGALRVLRNDGFSTLGDLVASVLPEHDHRSRARVGDVGAIEAEAFGHALCVVDFDRVHVLTPDGFGTLDRTAMVRAFKVG